MNLDYVVNRRFEPIIQSYDARDSALYALSLGIGDDPLDGDELPYVYEGREPRAVPSQCVTLGWPPFWHEEPAAKFPGGGYCMASRASSCIVPCPCKERSRGTTA